MTRGVEKTRDSLKDGISIGAIPTHSLRPGNVQSPSGQPAESFWMEASMLPPDYITSHWPGKVGYVKGIWVPKKMLQTHPNDVGAFVWRLKGNQQEAIWSL